MRPKSVAPSESICNSFREVITGRMIFLPVRRTRNVNLAFETQVASCRAVMNGYRQISNSLSEIPFALGSGNLTYTFPIDRRLVNIATPRFAIEDSYVNLALPVPRFADVNQTFHEERTRSIQANTELLGGTTDSLLPKLYSSG